MTHFWETLNITKHFRSPTDASFQNLSHAYLGSCILDSLSLVLTTASSDVRSAHIVNLLHNVYFDAFSNAVSHVNAEVGVFSKDQFIRELKRLAVYSAVSVLSEKLNFCQKVTEDDVISLFKDVMKLCETLIWINKNKLLLCLPNAIKIQCDQISERARHIPDESPIGFKVIFI